MKLCPRKICFFINLALGIFSIFCYTNFFIKRALAVDPPILSEVTAIGITNDNTPSYTFNSDEGGTISYIGDCASSTTVATSGNNTITLNTLTDDTYVNCALRVDDGDGNISDSLYFSNFKVDTTPPTVYQSSGIHSPTIDSTPSYTLGSNEGGSITYGGSCTSSGLSSEAIRIYKGGMRVDTINSGSDSIESAYSSSIPFKIALGETGFGSWDGKVDEVKVYDYGKPTLETTNSIDTGLIGYWKMDEASWVDDCSSETVMDSSSSLNGIACESSSGLTTVANGKINRAGNFDGDDQIEIPDTDFPIGNDSRAISAWVKPSRIDDTETIFYYGTQTQQSAFFVRRINNHFCIGRWGGGDTCGSTNIEEDIWYHILITYDGSHVYLYLNGSSQAQTLKTYNTSLTGNFYIGSYGDSNERWEGLIDEVRFYNRFIGPTIQSIYNYDPILTEDTDPVNFWNFNEGSGTNVIDKGLDGYDGTLANDSGWLDFDDCISGKCIDFGLSSSLTTSDRAGSLNGVTYDLWINPANVSSFKSIIFHGDNSNNLYSKLLVNDANLEFHIYETVGNRIGRSAVSSLEAGQWQHIVATWSRGNTAIAGSNLLVFDELENGTYSDCTITVTDNAGNESEPLEIASFDVGPIVTLTEVTPINSPTEDPTPLYTLNSTDATNLYFTGACSDTDPISIPAGDNTISIGPLAVGSYEDCFVEAHDNDGYTVSYPLYLGEFEITEDVTPDTENPTVPGAPTHASPTANLDPHWSWTASTDDAYVDHYVFQWCSNSSFSGCGSNIASTPSAHFQHLVYLSEGTWYARVKAVDPSDNESDWSAIGEVRIDLTSPEVTITSTSRTKTTITVNWTTNELTAAQISWNEDEIYNNFTQIATYSLEHSYTITNLDSDTKYYIAVFAEDQVRNITTTYLSVKTKESTGNDEEEETDFTVTATTTEHVYVNNPPSSTNGNSPLSEDNSEENETNEIVETERNGSNSNNNENKESTEASSSNTFIRNVIQNSNNAITNSVQAVQDVSASPLSQVASATVAIAPALPAIGIGATSFFSILPYLSFSHISFLFSGLIKKKRNPWGVVFDSKTKQPLDPVVLTLKDKKGKVISQTISDLYGRYEFLVAPGTYILNAKKTDYIFPSKNYTDGRIDEVYEDIYLGSEVTVSNSGKITYNIPMDPTKENFNEIAKASKFGIGGVSTKEKVLTKTFSVLFKVGGTYSLISTVASPTQQNLLILSVYAILIGYNFYKSKVKSWGIILDKYNKPVSNAVVKLTNVKIPKLRIPPVVTDETGRYFYLLDKGTYQVQVLIKDAVQNNYVSKYMSSVIEIKNDYGAITNDIKIS